MSNIMIDDVDEDYFDDPIRLFENEQSRVFYSDLKKIIIEDPREVDLTEHKTSVEIRSCCQTLLPIRFFDNEKNIRLLSKCRPLCIKVIDCMKTTSFDQKYMSTYDIDKYKQSLRSKMAAFYHKKFDRVTKHIKQNETVNTVFQFPFPGKVNNNVSETTSTLSPREPCNKRIYTSTGEIPHICDKDMRLKLKAGLETLKKNDFTNTESNKIAPLLNQKSQSNSKQIFQIERVITNRNSQNQHLTKKINKTPKIPVNNVTTYLCPKITCDIKETHKIDPYFFPTLSSNLVNLSEKSTVSKPNHSFINQLQSPLISMNNQEMLLNTRSCTVQKNHKQNRNNLMYVPNPNYPNTKNAVLIIKKPLDSKGMYNIADMHPLMAKALDHSIREKILDSNEKTDGQNDTHSAHMSNQNQSINSNKVSVMLEPNVSIAIKKANHNNQEADNKESYNINKQNCVRSSEYRKTTSMNTLKKPENTCKGYSPPILPIPTYEKVFEVISKLKFFYFEGDKMFINYSDNKNNKDIPMQNLPQQPIIKPSNKRKITDEKEKVARKITINEYKKRVTKSMKNIID